MSVINQMLQDLDKRNNNQQTSNNSNGISPNSHPLYRTPKGQKKLVFRILLISIVVLITIALSYYLGGLNTHNISSQQTNEPLKQLISKPKQENIQNSTLVEVNKSVTNTNNGVTLSKNKENITNLSSKNSDKTQNDISINERPSPLVQSEEIIEQSKENLELNANGVKKNSTKKIILKQNKHIPTKNIEETRLPKLIQKNTTVHTDKKTEQALASELADSNAKFEIKYQTLTTKQLVKIELKKASIARGKGDLKKERQHLRQVLKLDPKDNGIRSELASLYYGAGATSDAVSTLEQGLVISPNYAQFRLILARIFVQQNNHAQAYYYLKPLRPLIEDNLDYYAMLAALAQKNNDSKTAQEGYLQLTSIQPEKAQWWLGLAISQDKLLLNKQAKKSYQQAQLMGQLSNSSRLYIEQRLKALANKS